jgi:hypothetical protein
MSPTQYRSQTRNLSQKSHNADKMKLILKDTFIVIVVRYDDIRRIEIRFLLLFAAKINLMTLYPANFTVNELFNMRLYYHTNILHLFLKGPNCYELYEIQKLCLE